MNEYDFNSDFFNFLISSPTPFHAVSSMATHFRNNGFIQLFEQETWNIDEENSYFIIRDDGALIAFSIDSWSYAQKNGFRILGAHCDSPCLQIKPQPDINNQKFHQLGVEIYGGALLNPWFDRDLSIAGRVFCRQGKDSLLPLLLDFRRPLLVIPSLAIHFDREVNKIRSINPQQHILPVLSQVINDSFPDFKTILKEQIAKDYQQSDIQEILSYDMFCYDTQAPNLVGYKNEFISGSRLDNLLSCYIGLIAMIEGKASHRNCMFICNNHEETGSTSATGALGSFPMATFTRLFPDTTSRQICLSRSFFISMDNAHGVHPNYADKSDASHHIFLNHGPVVKLNANQRYATNSHSNALFHLLAKEVDVQTQEFVMKNDMACGSTIGPLIAAQLGVRTVDVGAPTLAMHSIRELTGSLDPSLLYRTIAHFLSREHLPGEKN
jgi:aspartyl aminopeptidase